VCGAANRALFVAAVWQRGYCGNDCVNYLCRHNLIYCVNRLWSGEMRLI